jgi:hypothetical protein
MLMCQIQRLPAPLQTDPSGDLYLVDLEKDGYRTRCRIRLGSTDLLRWPGHSAERVIEESIRFLLERVPLHALLGSFDLGLLERQYPDYVVELTRRLLQ